MRWNGSEHTYKFPAEECSRRVICANRSAAEQEYNEAVGIVLFLSRNGSIKRFYAAVALDPEFTQINNKP
jgi:hypothetical protein